MESFNLNKLKLNKIFKLIPKIIETDEFLIYNQSNYPVWAPVVDEFHQLVYDLNIIILFDWTNWKEGSLILKDVNFDYSSLDSLTLVKLITTIVRAERFNEGFLPKCFSNGTILKILNALKAKTD